MEQTTDRVEVRRELEIAASPETVWGFLVDPAKAHIWWGKAVSFEPRPGSPFRVEISSRSVASGEILEVDPPRRLVYTWGWELGGAGPERVPPGSTTVEIDLEPSGSGTILRLLHRDLPDENAAAEHGAGWDHYLGRLATVAAGGDPGADPWREARP